MKSDQPQTQERSPRRLHGVVVPLRELKRRARRLEKIAKTKDLETPITKTSTLLVAAESITLMLDAVVYANERHNESSSATGGATTNERKHGL